MEVCSGCAAFFGIDYSYPKLSGMSKYQSQSLFSDQFLPNFSAFWDNLETYLELEHLINPCP